jgi:hypothetical protein
MGPFQRCDLSPECPSFTKIKAEGLPEEWKSWGTGFIKTEMWIEIVYRSLTAK